MTHLLGNSSHHGPTLSNSKSSFSTTMLPATSWNFTDSGTESETSQGLDWRSAQTFPLPLSPELRAETRNARKCGPCEGKCTQNIEGNDATCLPSETKGLLEREGAEMGAFGVREKGESRALKLMGLWEMFTVHHVSEECKVLTESRRFLEERDIYEYWLWFWHVAVTRTGLYSDS